jgi:hypothetical protein
VKEHPRVTRERIAARAARRLREADLAGKAAAADEKQREIRQRLAAELKARFAQHTTPEER